MTQQDIQQKMLRLQAELNQLAGQLPDGVEVDFLERAFRRNTDIGLRKQLVIAFRAREQAAAVAAASSVAVPAASSGEVEYAVDLLCKV
ncbi:MAG: hypothetical protein ACRYGK_00610 [Janthinobacterium lividum]